MLEHFHAGHRIETARLLGGQIFHRLHAIVDLHAGFQAVQTRHLDQLRCQIDRSDLRAQARHRFAEQPAAAADVEYARTGKI